MKVLFIGGTGNISTSVSKLCVDKGIDLYLLNRNKRKTDINGAIFLNVDINDQTAVKKALSDQKWDAVVNWIAYTLNDIERDLELFSGKTSQYIFISSASVYQKPPTNAVITESTPLYNPFWQYSRDKIACEERLIKEYREKGFPITIVRPSHTYDTVLPTAVGGWTDYGLIERMKKGKKIIVHGDGTSLWTLTHSKDFAKGFFGLLGNIHSIGHTFHITSDEVFTWNQIYGTIGKAIGIIPDLIHIPTDFIVKVDPEQLGGLWGDKAHCAIFDNSKIKQFVPGYVATIPFSEGIKETIAWFEADKSRMVVNYEIEKKYQEIIDLYAK